MADFDGVRGNDLVGYGLVVGLNGTGDSMRNAPYAEDMLAGILERLGVNVIEDSLRSKNVAAVIVTATLPEFSRSGSRIDVNVSTIGDAKSLLGGTLVMTPLKAADGNIYAVAQGSIISGGTAVSGDTAHIVDGVPTSGVIPVGATIEREVDFDFSSVRNIRLALRDADFTTASRIVIEINKKFNRNVAALQDSRTVILDVQNTGKSNPAQVISMIENITVEPEAKARVVIDHRTGTIVLGSQVTVSKVAVSQGNITMKVSEETDIYQPNPFSIGETFSIPRSSVNLEEDAGIGFSEVSGEVSLNTLIDGLNALGVRPRDMIDILQSIHAAGALHADLLVR